MAFNLTKKQIGNLGEDLALQEYLKQGYLLVARNYYNQKGRRLGEIDLVVKTDIEIVFVEVKTRQSLSYGQPTEAITRQKRTRLLKTVLWFFRNFPEYLPLKPRIDVCSVSLDKTHTNVIIVPSAIEE